MKFKFLSIIFLLGFNVFYSADQDLHRKGRLFLDFINRSGYRHNFSADFNSSVKSSLKKEAVKFFDQSGFRKDGAHLNCKMHYSEMEKVFARYLSEKCCINIDPNLLYRKGPFLLFNYYKSILERYSFEIERLSESLPRQKSNRKVSFK